MSFQRYGLESCHALLLTTYFASVDICAPYFPRMLHVIEQPSMASRFFCEGYLPYRDGCIKSRNAFYLCV